MEKHFIDSKNAATNVANLGLNIDQLLASMYMLQIPGDYRSELERSLTNKKLDKYTFDDLSVIMEEMLRIHGHQLSNDATGDSKTPVELEVKMGVSAM